MRRIGVGCAIAAVALTGCRVDSRVEITMHGDGTGVIHVAVVLDGDAVQRVGGIDAARSQVPLDDMKAAGWTVSPWTSGAGGGATVSFTHPFRGQADLRARLIDLLGANGMVRNVAITRDRGWIRSRDALSMVVDLRAPTTGIGSDADLKARLQAYGVNPDEINADLTTQLRSSFHLVVLVHLPDGTTRQLDAANGTTTTFHASDEKVNYDTVVKLGIAFTLALLAGVFLLAARASARRDRRRRAQRMRAPHTEHERAPLM